MTNMEKSMRLKAKAYKKHGMLDKMAKNAERIRKEIIEENLRVR